ncbi:hypothetical protein [Aquimarina sp. AU474]|uniref:hypothetical protein n=1 Tax=Aquimarina sp. AU474 TaxID=2108529 RepID=UPI000D6903E0|nr:hypothetical protein [Aquimarina sp. AU474]
MKLKPVEKIIKTLLLSTSLITFMGCASFKEKYSVDKNIGLTKNNIQLINKNFAITASKEVRKYQDYNLEIIENDTVFNLFARLKIIDTTFRKEIAKYRNNYVVNLRVKEKNTLVCSLIKNTKIVDSTSLRYKLKNGYLYIKNSNVTINDIPLIYGGFEIDRLRLGINKNGDLITDSSHYFIATAMIVLGDDRKFYSSSLYKQIIKPTSD